MTKVTGIRTVKFFESESENACSIIDNKSYSKGYNITNDHRLRMEDEYIKKFKGYSKKDKPLRFFLYISNDFGKTINSKLAEIHRNTGINGAAISVDLFIKIVKEYADKGYTHGDLFRIFAVNREVRLADLKS